MTAIRNKPPNFFVSAAVLTTDKDVRLLKKRWEGEFVDKPTRGQSTCRLPRLLSSRPIFFKNLICGVYIRSKGGFWIDYAVSTVRCQYSVG